MPLRYALHRQRFLFRLVAAILASLTAGVFIAHHCPAQVCSQTKVIAAAATAQTSTADLEPAPLKVTATAAVRNVNINRNMLEYGRRATQLSLFDYQPKRDVLVFIHVQKTGGTHFEERLVTRLNVSRPCLCRRKPLPWRSKHVDYRCDCRDEAGRLWLFGRFTVGWACGVHASWTDMQDGACVRREMDQREYVERERRYLYITMLRDPVQRYLSEWKHVQRGSTWMAAKLKCNGREASLDEVPFCFTGDNWEGVTLSEFTSCEFNLANNRQTRMLANLSLVGCYNRSAMSAAQRDFTILKSAKDNLQKMAFFGLTEFQRESQYLFERTFKLKFIDNFRQYNSTHASAVAITKKSRQKVVQLNRLDIELYQFAKDLFLQRLDFMKRMEQQEARRKRRSSVINRSRS